MRNLLLFLWCIPLLSFTQPVFREKADIIHYLDTLSIPSSTSWVDAEQYCLLMDEAVSGGEFQAMMVTSWHLDKDNLYDHERERIREMLWGIPSDKIVAAKIFTVSAQLDYRGNWLGEERAKEVEYELLSNGIERKKIIKALFTLMYPAGTYPCPCRISPQGRIFHDYALIYLVVRK